MGSASFFCAVFRGSGAIDCGITETNEPARQSSLFFPEEMSLMLVLIHG